MLGKMLKELLLPKKTTQDIGHTANTPQFPQAHQADGGNILCFTAASEGDALAVFTRELSTPFANKARDIKFFNINEPGWFEELGKSLAEPVWFAMSFFGTGQQINVIKGDRPANLWEAHGIPFIRYYGDIPAYFPDRHMQLQRGSVNVYTDQAHLDFYRRWFPQPALSVLMLPTLLDTMPLEKMDVEAKLRGKIIFPKNGNSPSGLIRYWRNALPARVARLLESVAEDTIGRDAIDLDPRFDDRLIARFGESGIDLAAEPAILLFLVAQLDDYVRRIKSTMIGEALLDLPVIIRGRAWEHVNFTGKRATYDPDSDVVRTQALIDQAPAVVDMSPNKQHSVHDRIRRAAGRWTAFLTNRTAYLDALMPAPERFSFAFEREAIRSLVDHYATRPRDAIDLGLEQARALRAAFDEEAYAENILTAASVSAMAMRERPAGTQNFVDYPPKYFGIHPSMGPI